MTLPGSCAARSFRRKAPSCLRFGQDRNSQNFGGRVMTLPYNVYFETPMGDINKGEKEIWAS